MSTSTEIAPSLPPISIDETATPDALAAVNESATVAPLPVAEAAPEATPLVVDAPVPEVEASPAEAKVEEVAKVEEEKKEKKAARKPFADLLNKIRKPLEKPAPEKKEAEPLTVEEASVAQDVAPAQPVVDTVAETAPAEPAAVAEVAPDVVPVEEALKDVTTPRKERGNLFEKITAFVMKPKSPKGKKSSEPVKEEPEEAKPVEAPAATEAVETTSEVAAAPTPEAEAPTTEGAPATTAAPAEEVVPVAESPEEVKVEKKEKTPKDLAKLARRFSGRLFGTEKKEKVAKKPEATKEEVEESPAAEAVAPADVAAEPSTEPAAEVPAPAEPVTETTLATEATPVIAATA